MPSVPRLDRSRVQRTSTNHNQNQNLSNPQTVRNVNIDLKEVPAASSAPYVLLYSSFCEIRLKTICFRKNIPRAMPLWGKIILGVTAFILVTGAIVGPSVYFGLKGKLDFIFVSFATSRINQRFEVIDVLRIAPCSSNLPSLVRKVFEQSQML